MLPPVMELLAGYGHVGGAAMDTPLLQLLAAKCGIEADDSVSWAAMPYALALMFLLPEWGQAVPNVGADGLSGNLHCIVYALDALLCVAEPHVHKPHSNLPSEVLAASTGRCAHRCFLEVASLVLLKQRQLIRRAAE